MSPLESARTAMGWLWVREFSKARHVATNLALPDEPPLTPPPTLQHPPPLVGDNKNTARMLHCGIISRAKMEKMNFCDQVRALPIDKLDVACTNAHDWMILVQHRSDDRVMS